MGSPEKSPANANNSKQRVKVYRLNDDGKWDHQGTGHVSVDYTERSEELGLFVVDEEDNETLLLHRISSDVIYRKQEDITISWRDLEYSTELALSFQETTGCTYIWDNICHVQRNLHFNTLNNDSFHGVNSELRELPAVELSTLPLILKDTEKYEGLEYLGSGKFGEVWLVENKATKERFAMKRIERGRKFEKYMAREIKIQKQLCHSNVIQFMEVVLSLSYLGIVMEYADGGNLHDEIFLSRSNKRLDENMARYYFQQIISGVSYLHSRDICHRDLKPGNILLDGSDPPCLKICDFGYSKSGRLHSKPKSAVGTPQYMAPEVRETEYDGKLADLWSCGAILYAMLVGKNPNYRPNDTGETSNVYETNACPVSLPNSLSPKSKDLLARMLVADPRKRITIEDVKKHQWFKKLKRKLPEATQVTKENPRLSLQSDEEIDKIVEEAQILPEDAIGQI